MVQQYPSSTNWEKKIGVILHVSIVVAIILLFYDDFVMTKRLNKSDWKYKTEHLN